MLTLIEGVEEVEDDEEEEEWVELEEELDEELEELLLLQLAKVTPKSAGINNNFVIFSFNISDKLIVGWVFINIYE